MAGGVCALAKLKRAKHTIVAHEKKNDAKENEHRETVTLR
jgi:hypothetical protein